MTRLRDMPEGGIDMLGPGIPDERYHDIRSAAGALVLSLGIVAGYYCGITHPQQTQDALQIAHDVVTEWWANTLG